MCSSPMYFLQRTMKFDSAFFMVKKLEKRFICFFFFIAIHFTYIFEVPALLPSLLACSRRQRKGARKVADAHDPSFYIILKMCPLGCATGTTLLAHSPCCLLGCLQVQQRGLVSWGSKTVVWKEL